MASSAARTRYRARVSARERGRGRGSRIRWDRLGRVVLLVVLFALLVSYIGPALHVVESWRESNAAEQRLSELKQEHRQLSKRAEELKSTAATIAEARRYGLSGADEVPYVIDGLR